MFFSINKKGFDRNEKLKFHARRNLAAKQNMAESVTFLSKRENYALIFSLSLSLSLSHFRCPKCIAFAKFVRSVCRYLTRMKGLMTWSEN